MIKLGKLRSFIGLVIDLDQSIQYYSWNGQSGNLQTKTDKIYSIPNYLDQHQVLTLEEWSRLKL